MSAEDVAGSEAVESIVVLQDDSIIRTGVETAVVVDIHDQITMSGPGDEYVVVKRTSGPGKEVLLIC